MLLRAAGARRFAWNWAVAKIKANADQWAAEASYGMEPVDRVRPLSYFSLGKLWTAERPDVAPWAGEHSTWAFRYALRDAVDAHAAFLAGKRGFPRLKARHGTESGSPSATGWRWRQGGYASRSTTGFASSKTCSACGAVRPKLALAERTYRCDACGLIADRDANAAADLAAWGEHTLGLCPCVTRAGNRHPGGPSAEGTRHARGGWVSAATSQAAAVPPGEAGTSQPRPGVA